MTDEEIQKQVVAIPSPSSCYCKVTADCKQHQRILTLARSLVSKARAEALEEAAEAKCKHCRVSGSPTVDGFKHEVGGLRIVCASQSIRALLTEKE